MRLSPLTSAATSGRKSILREAWDGLVFDAEFSRQLASWAVVIAAWVVFVGALFYAAQYTAFGLKVFEVYHHSAEGLLRGESIYDGTNGWIYLYPPLLSQLLMPVVALFDYAVASNLWLSSNIALLVITLVLLARHIPPHWLKWLWLFPLVFIPVWQALYIGQVTIILLALLTAIWAALHENHSLLAGILLAFAAWIKVFPALLIVYFLWKRNWRLLLGVALGGVALLMFQLMISGPELFIDFTSVLFSLAKDGQPELTYENLSVFAFVSRLFQPNVHVIPLIVSEDLFQIMRVVMSGSLIGTVAYTLVQSGRRTTYSKADIWRQDMEYGLVLLTILLIGTTLWISGLPAILLIGLLALQSQRHTHLKRVKVVWWMAFALILASQPLIVLVNVTGITLGALPLSVGFFGLMLLWGLMVYLLIADPVAVTTQELPAQKVTVSG